MNIKLMWKKKQSHSNNVNSLPCIQSFMLSHCKSFDKDICRSLTSMFSVFNIIFLHFQPSDEDICRSLWCLIYLPDGWQQEEWIVHSQIYWLLSVSVWIQGGNYGMLIILCLIINVQRYWWIVNCLANLYFRIQM